MLTYLCSRVSVSATRNESGDGQISIAEKAKEVYESDFKARLEADHRDEFVAIEPVSKSFFLGDTFIDAALAANTGASGPKVICDSYRPRRGVSHRDRFIVIGIVDEKGRALLDVPVSDKLDSAYTPVTTWIDTAFDGHLVFPHELIETLN